jgi:hypothetical protein
VANILTENTITAHNHFGHTHGNVANDATKKIGIIIRRQIQLCNDCEIGKTKKKSFSKFSPKKATEKGEIIAIDISSNHNDALVVSNSGHWKWSNKLAVLGVS